MRGFGRRSAPTKSRMADLPHLQLFGRKRSREKSCKRISNGGAKQVPKKMTENRTLQHPQNEKEDMHAFHSLRKGNRARHPLRRRSTHCNKRTIKPPRNWTGTEQPWKSWKRRDATKRKTYGPRKRRTKTPSKRSARWKRYRCNSSSNF